MGFWEKCDRECTWNKICCWVWAIGICGGVLAVLIVAFAVLFPPMVIAEDAVLQRFDLIMAGTTQPAANSSISYNATVTLALLNLNIYRGISYGPLEASFFFNGSRFHRSIAMAAGFYHKPRKMVRLPLTVGGVDSLAASGALEFEAENKTGGFGLELRLETVMRYKGLNRVCAVVVICPLKLQLVHPGVPRNATDNCSENGDHNFCPTRCYNLVEEGGGGCTRV